MLPSALSKEVRDEIVRISMKTDPTITPTIGIPHKNHLYYTLEYNRILKHWELFVYVLE